MINMTTFTVPIIKTITALIKVYKQHFGSFCYCKTSAVEVQKEIAYTLVAEENLATVSMEKTKMIKKEAKRRLCEQAIVSLNNFRLYLYQRLC